MTRLLITDIHNTVQGALMAEGRSCIAYTPFGCRRPAHTLPALGFNGQRAEALTWRYHLGHGCRTYDPALYRVHSPDKLSPFGKGGLNVYAYCHADPVNRADPSGAVEVPDWLMPVVTIVANTLVFGATLLAAISGKPVGIGLMGTRIALVGAPVAVLGGIVQLTEHKDIGRVLAIAGSIGGGVGAGVRGFQMARNIATKSPPGTFGQGMRHVLGWRSKKPDLKPPAVAPDKLGEPTLRQRSSSLRGSTGGA